MKKTIIITICSTALLSVSAQAAVVFEADFESGTAANTGSITYVSGAAQIATESSPHPKHGTNALFADPSSQGGVATDITFTPTIAADLTGGSTAVISLDVQWRRTNGTNKSHYLTGYDSSDNEIFQLVLADLNEFSNNAGNDRQQPGWGNSTGSLGFLAGDIASGTAPGTFYIANDGNHANGYNGVSAHFDVTVSNDGFTIGGTGSFAGPFTTNTLATFNGTTHTDLAYVKYTGETTGAGSYIDNVVIETFPVPEPSSTALLGLGGLALILRRRK